MVADEMNQSNYLLQVIKSASQQLFSTAGTTVQHSMRGDAATGRDLDRAGLLPRRVVRRVA
jgi:hypothetical protein